MEKVPGAGSAPRSLARNVAICQAASIVLLVIGALLVSNQSPILPIEISVVLAILSAWVLWRRSRAAALTLACVDGLLVVLSIHILLGDLPDKGPSELVPDVLVLLALLGGVAASVALARGARRRSAAPDGNADGRALTTLRG